MFQKVFLRSPQPCVLYRNKEVNIFNNFIMFSLEQNKNNPRYDQRGRRQLPEKYRTMDGECMYIYRKIPVCWVVEDTTCMAATIFFFLNSRVNDITFKRDHGPRYYKKKNLAGDTRNSSIYKADLKQIWREIRGTLHTRERIPAKFLHADTQTLKIGTPRDCPSVCFIYRYGNSRGVPTLTSACWRSRFWREPRFRVRACAQA